MSIHLISKQFLTGPLPAASYCVFFLSSCLALEGLGFFVFPHHSPDPVGLQITLGILHKLPNWRKLAQLHQLQHLYTSYSDKADSLKQLEARESHIASRQIKLQTADAGVCLKGKLQIGM